MKSIPYAICSMFILVGCVRDAMAGRVDGRLDIYWVDVEGGAATLIVTPLDECVLIDTGNPGLRDASRINHAITDLAKLRAVDHMIITHYHRDHYGGAEVVSRLLPIHNVYDNGVFEGMRDNPGKKYFEFACKHRHVIQPGDIIPLRQDESAKVQWKLQCLGARTTFVDPDSINAKNNETARALHFPKNRDGSDNANSVVMLLRFGKFQFFDGGDLTWNQEKRLVHPFNLVGEVDVYQVTHHGLDSSNNPIVLKSLKPRVAIMNNGHEKGCMPEVFANLKETSSLKAIYQVHKNLRPDGRTNNVPDEFIANHEPAENCRGHHIKLSVAPDGMTYTVSIPARNHLSTYMTE